MTTEGNDNQNTPGEANGNGNGNANGNGNGNADGNGNGNEAVPAAAPAGEDGPGAPAPSRTTPPAPGGIAPRRSWIRRVLGHRTAVAATAAGLVGVLLGAGTVAWRTGTLPLATSDPCWDSLSKGSVSALFGDRRLKAEEQELRRDPRVASLSYGQCRITSYEGERARRQAIVKVHQLDGLYGKDGHTWPAEFLSSRMVALGDLPGMVSASRAWLALPQSCVGRPGRMGGATVVDVALGEHDFDSQFDFDRRDRAAMARVIVDATNGVMRDLGCTGTYAAPGKLPDLPTWGDLRPDSFCGVKGLELPARYRKWLETSRVGGDGGAARTCDAGQDYRSRVRMSTVVDPTVTGIYSLQLRSGGASVDGTRGHGVISPNRAVYRVECQTGEVVMTVETADRTDGADFVKDLLPGYVKAETERIGCGSVDVELPTP
ncbi:hypothetical protein G3I31_21080 [Streptomyces sp. SID9913]|uniref:hypothetical protein n=1 Tax=Streptomyces sp. SID9913 TaxID=2706117 RepID=UPI0013DBEAB6|nr:hypothetical protein [Streptomyces sp. SID9913]